MQETQVQSLGGEDPLEKGMATHSSILAWEILWTEKPGRLQSLGLQRVGHNLATKPPNNSPAVYWFTPLLYNLLCSLINSYIQLNFSDEKKPLCSQLHHGRFSLLILLHPSNAIYIVYHLLSTLCASTSWHIIANLYNKPLR